MSSPIPTLREYGEYLESLDRPLDIDALLVAERGPSGSGAAAPGARFDDLARDLDALEPVGGEAMVADLGASPGHRTGRRRWLVVAAAAVTVAVISVTVLAQGAGDEGIRTRVPAGSRQSGTTIPTPPTSASAHPGFDALMRSEGATPPKTGKLVASAWLGGDLGVYYLYADGRLIWWDDVSGAPGWVEQHLTSEGVERVRSEFLATGLFDLAASSEHRPGCAPYWPDVCVRDGGRLLSRTIARGQRVREPGVYDVYAFSPEEQLLLDHLATLPSSLPPTDWADQQINAYVPAKYAVCLDARSPVGSYTPRLDPSKALKALPARAAKLLRGHRADLTIGEVSFNGGSPCFVVTTGTARVLANELVDAFGAPASRPGLDTRYGFEIDAEVDRPHVKRFGITFTQLLPNGAIAVYYSLIQ